MPYCPKCGFAITEESFCPRCGAKQPTLAEYENRIIGASRDIRGSEKQGRGCPSAGEKIRETIQSIFNTPDTTSEFDEDDIALNKSSAVLSYLSLLVLIPFLAKKKSKFAQFHANQGAALFVATIILLIALSLALEIAGILGANGIIKFLVCIPFIAAAIICFCMAVFGMINALQGKAKTLPLLGRLQVLPQVTDPITRG